MRLSDLLEKPKKQAAMPKAGSKEVAITSEQLVKALKTQTSIANRKIDELPKETEKELRPHFSALFWKKSSEVKP